MVWKRQCLTWCGLSESSLPCGLSAAVIFCNYCICMGSESVSIYEEQQLTVTLDFCRFSTIMSSSGWRITAVAVALTLATSTDGRFAGCTNRAAEEAIGFCNDYCDVAAAQNLRNIGCIFCPCACEEAGVDCSFNSGMGNGDAGESEGEADGPDGEAPGEAATTESPETEHSTSDATTELPETEPGTSDAPTPTETETQDAGGDTTSGPECPRNCGSAGECFFRRDGAPRCLSCDSDRLLDKGFCYRSLACKSRRVQTGGRTGESCTCLDPHCHYCNRDASGDVCRRCRDGWYLLNGACVENCPADMTSAGINLFGRRCLEPFTCSKNRLQISEPVNFGCKCPDPGNTLGDCFQCNFNAGEYGQECTRCRGGKYLLNNQCVDSCEGTGLVAYGPSSYGRECRESFVCNNRVDENGQMCKCRAGCRVCRWEASGHVCLD